jgi:hypothetical protein
LRPPNGAVGFIRSGPEVDGIEPNTSWRTAAAFITGLRLLESSPNGAVGFN